MDFLELPASLTELCGGYDHNEVILRATKTKKLALVWLKRGYPQDYRALSLLEDYQIM